MKPLVYILWVDAVSDDPWIHISELESSSHKIETIGMLIAENEDVYSVSHTHDLDSDSFCCIIHIPKLCVKDFHYLKAVKD